MVTDIDGVVWKGRNELMDPWKERYARDTKARTLGEVIGGADVFLGLSAAGVLKPRDGGEDGGQAADLRAGQSRSRDHARGRARRCATTPSSPPAAPTIPTRSTTSSASPTSSAARSMSARRPSTTTMKIACVRALAELARKEPSEVVAARLRRAAVGGFGPNQIIPKPFDPRLIVELAPAVAKAAMDSRRGDAADRRLRRLSPAAQPVRLQVRPGDAAGVRAGAQRDPSG